MEGELRIGLNDFLGNGLFGNTAVHCLFFYVAVSFRLAQRM